MRSFSKISVIGGSGFVGTHLCQKLADRHIAFEIIDLKQSPRFPDQTTIGDIRDIDSLRQAITGDLVVSLAAVHRDDIRDTSEYARTNVDGARNLAAVCAEKNIRKIVFTSSIAVYGFAAPGTDETGAINPIDAYGTSKFQAEEIFHAWHGTGDNALIILRPAVIFGEGNRGNVYTLLKQIASGRFMMIGSGRNRKSMAYIGNVVAFLEACVETERDYAVFNYVDTPDMDMNTLVRQVRKTLTGRDSVGFRLPRWIGMMSGYLADGVTRITGTTLPLSAIRVKKFCTATTFTSAKSELDGFEPPYALTEGLARTLYSEFMSPDPKRDIFPTE